MLDRYLLCVDGGASNSRALLWDEQEKKILKDFKGRSCNALLISEHEMSDFLQLLKNTFTDAPKIHAVAFCLAGVNSESVKKNLTQKIQKNWPQSKIFLNHDLCSALYSGIPDGNGIVALSGTGACVYGKNNYKKYKIGGWGHILGDEGSAYQIAHKALRWVTREYDKKKNMDSLCALFIKQAQVKSIEELAQFATKSEKKDIALLAMSVFEAAHDNHKEALKIIQNSSAFLAEGVNHIARKLKLSPPTITVAGSVFLKQDLFLNNFKQHLSKETEYNLVMPHENPAIGCLNWLKEILSTETETFPHQTTKIHNHETSLEHIKKHINLSQIQTENSNPNTKNLSNLSISESIELFIEEDKRIHQTLLEESQALNKLIKTCSEQLKAGGRLIYVGAGTSGRLGVLDAAECPPTFGSPYTQVQALIAGGSDALTRAIEGAEDSSEQGSEEIKKFKLKSNDFICGIAASGRTPYVHGALKASYESGAKTGLIACNPQIKNQKMPYIHHLVSYNSGPESLTGSTRMRAGTVTKMALNMISTLSMIQLGKVESNYMIDLKATNLKLKARAIRLVCILSSSSEEKAYETLCAQNWNVRETLKVLKV